MLLDLSSVFFGMWALLPWLLGVGVLTVIGFLVTDTRKPTVRPIYFYRRKESVMTPAEAKAFSALVEVVGSDFYVFPQLHLPSFLDHTTRGQNWRAAFRHIDEKSVDFVLCGKDLTPQLVIELDDWSHARSDRQERDKEVERILQQAGIPLLRILDTQDLAAKISQVLRNV
jgi:DNA phosphorothioation-dependent restriction protein DptG